MHTMLKPHFRIAFTALVLLFVIAVLAREHLNGGVVTHHFMHRADMPGMSNWWSLLLLPALSWFLVGRMQKRVTAESHRIFTSAKLPINVVLGFLAALAYGIALSAGFSFGYGNLTGYLFQGLILVALLLPIYRAECLLGFVLGMSVVFGAMIPIVFGSLLAALSAFVHLVLWPALLRLGAWIKSR